MEHGLQKSDFKVYIVRYVNSKKNSLHYFKVFVF